ncbi:potassium channel family protein [Caldimonas tepidiphila]|uniref:potassium channel family protein n=1 Tax=Caldimonas tepidiphila TaxID=2315841 RepID=UPI000E5C4C07|nr:potassium channel family protein [Caldimonas tepidiphila]
MGRRLADARARLYRQLEPSARAEPGLSALNRLIVSVILISVAVAVLETEPLVARGREALFWWIELAIGLFFGIEYLLRVWVSAEDPDQGGGLRGRLRYMASPAALLDLLAIAPLLFLAIGPQAYMLRLARLGRFSGAIDAVSEALHSRRFELLASIGFALGLLLLTSTLMYILEAEAQPEVFGSIPRAMWWSVVTLTTVGYGDSYPVTAAGRILAGLTAVTGIGLIAMPTGILAAAFSDALQARRERERRQDGGEQR